MKPLIILLVFFLVFSLFIYGITRPSEQSLAIKEVKTCFSVEEVKSCWSKHKQDLFDDEIFVFEVRKKLSSLNLSTSEIKGCISWLPPAPSSINLIVVPDLSNRISEQINPGQVGSDKRALLAIWESFKEVSRLRHDTKDRLIVDLTDVNQANGKFSDIANSLQFDLSKHVGKTNKLYFTKDKDAQFLKGVNDTYSLAAINPVGADYYLYLRQYLQMHLKKSTLFDRYVNKVIIITDGYLEPETGGSYTKITSQLKDALSRDIVLETITKSGLNIPKVKTDLSDTEFLICEVNERKSGQGKDFEILSEYWKDWFFRMKVKNANDDFFLQRQKASDITADRIHQFIASTQVTQ